jgi:hypothetical protein
LYLIFGGLSTILSLSIKILNLKLLLARTFAYLQVELFHIKLL